MAGYMTKLQGYLYEGELVNGANDPVENGIFMEQDGDKLVLPKTEGATKVICKEVTDIYDGIPAYRFVVNFVDGCYYLVENGFEYDNSQEYDLTKYTTKVGKHLRAHPIQVGEEFVTNMVTGTPVVGNAYTIKVDGTIG